MYSKFIQGLDTIKDQQAMATQWGTPDNIRTWLIANGGGIDETERNLAFQYAYPGTNAEAGNPIAQERMYAQRLERLLADVYNFKEFFPINKDYVNNEDSRLSQKVRSCKGSENTHGFVRNTHT